RERAGTERSTWMRFHTQTAGVSLSARQPLNNLTRVAIQALAAVLGGTQSLHTDAYDEAWAVPSAEAAASADGTAHASSYASVWSDWVPPRTAARAWIATRVKLFNGCRALSDTPAVCV